MLNKDARELFNNDPKFRELVHTMADMLKGGELSIPELRAAVSLAANLYSYTEPKSSIKVSVPMEGLRVEAIDEGTGGYRGRVILGEGQYWQTETCYLTEEEAKKAAGEFIVGLMSSGYDFIPTMLQVKQTLKDELVEKEVLKQKLHNFHPYPVDSEIVHDAMYKDFYIEIRKGVAEETGSFVGLAVNRKVDSIIEEVVVGSIEFAIEDVKGLIDKKTDKDNT